MYDFVSSDNIQETDVAVMLQASVHKISVWIGISRLTVVTEVTVFRLRLCGLWQCVVLEVDTHTGCPRRNGQNFGRVFLMLNYTDITQNTYIQSWTVTEIMAWEECGHLAFPRTVCLQLSRIDLDSAIKAVISVTARAPPNAIRQYFITAKYSCAM